MTHEWHCIAVVCVFMSVVTAVPSGLSSDASEVTLLDASPDVSTGNRLPPGTQAASEETLAVITKARVPAEQQAKKRKAQIKDWAARNEVQNAVRNSVSHAEELSVMDGLLVEKRDFDQMDKNSKELTRADRDVSKLPGESDYRAKAAKEDTDAPGQYAQALAEASRLDAEDRVAADEDEAFKQKTFGRAKRAAEKVEEMVADPDAKTKLTWKQLQRKKKRTHDRRMRDDPRYRYDNTPNRPVYEGLAAQAESDRGKEMALAAEADAFALLKKSKTGNVAAGTLPAAAARDKKQTRAERVEATIKQSHEDDAGDVTMNKQYKSFDSQFGEDMRTDFRHSKPVVMTTSPESELLYEQLKKQHAKHTDITLDVKRVKEAEDADNSALLIMLNESLANAPTKQSIAELVKERAAGVQNLVQESQLADTALSKAAASGKVPPSLKKALGKDTLSEVSLWSRAKLLKEGEDAVVRDADNLAESGSRGDLDVLNADVNRVESDKPTLAAAERNATKDNAEETHKMKRLLGEQKYKNFEKVLAAEAKKMKDAVNATTITAEAIEPTSVEIPTIDDDTPFPDHIDDPSLDPDVAADVNYNDVFRTPYDSMIKQNVPDMDEETDPRWIGLQYQDVDAPMDTITGTPLESGEDDDDVEDEYTDDMPM